MTTHRLAASAALAAALTLAALVPSASAGATTPPSLPQTAAVASAASWLAARLGPDGSIPSATTPNTPDLTATANAVLSLAVAGPAAHAAAVSALTFMEGHVAAYVADTGSDGPGQLALLILDAHALGVPATSFGGTDLVARLLATQQTAGPDAGLFGAQDATFDGAFRQGLSLAALAAEGRIAGPAELSAEAWLTAQQCPDGGWTSLVTTSNPCNGKPAKYAGPDTNSTALAVEGLEAQGALAPAAATSALRFLKKAENRDGGWGYEPHTPGSTDPDSTALVIQALLALGAPPASAPFTKSGVDPVASLLADQVTSGPGSGGIAFPGISGADMLATYQAIPALAGVTFAYDLGTPVVGKVSPSHGTVAGGTVVHLTGTSLTEVSSVSFGGIPATSFTLVSSKEIIAVAPAGGIGTVDVTVASPAGASSPSTADRFTYR